jgi:protein TonB
VVFFRQSMVVSAGVAGVLHGLLLWWMVGEYRHAAVSMPVLSFSLRLQAVSAWVTPVSVAAQAGAGGEAVAQAAAVRPRASVAVKLRENTQKSEMQPHPAAVPAQAQPAVLAAFVPARYDAAYLQNTPPAYPPVSRRMGEEGRVQLHVLVSAQGAAAQVLLGVSSGFARLDEAAMAAVRAWRFAPGQQGGPMVFTLENK